MKPGFRTSFTKSVNSPLSTRAFTHALISSRFSFMLLASQKGRHSVDISSSSVPNKSFAMAFQYSPTTRTRDAARQLFCISIRNTAAGRSSAAFSTHSYLNCTRKVMSQLGVDGESIASGHPLELTRNILQLTHGESIVNRFESIPARGL